MSERQQWINLIVMLIGGAVLFSFFFNRKISWWKRFLASFVAQIALYIFVIVTEPYMDALEAKWGGLFKSALARFALGLFTIMVGVGAHIYKQKNKLRYGQIEVAFGGFSAALLATGLKHDEDTVARLVGLGGAAYVVARGLNNWAEHLRDKGHKDGHRTVKQQVTSWIFEVPLTPSPETVNLPDGE